MNLFGLSGRTALVTGSTRGIGLALASGLQVPKSCGTDFLRMEKLSRGLF